MVEQKNNLAFHIQTDIHARNFKKREHSYPQELSTMAAVTQKKIAKVVVVNMNGKEIYQGPATEAAWRWLIGSGYVLSVDNAVLTRTLWETAWTNALKSEESNDVVVSAVLQESLLTRVGYALGRSNGVRYKRVELLDRDMCVSSPVSTTTNPPQPQTIMIPWQELGKQAMHKGLQMEVLGTASSTTRLARLQISVGRGALLIHLNEAG